MERLKKLLSRNEKILVAYAMAGFPDPETSLRAMKALLEGGADALEIGYPFSDPVADGSTIQRAHEVALKNGVGFKEVLETVRELRRFSPETPLLVMSYYNPIFKVGLERFVSSFKEAGADGFIVPDLPPEEGGELKAVCKNLGMATVFLAAPTSDGRRLSLICDATDCFTYFVSVTGITGERDELPLGSLEKKLEQYRKICPKKVVVGFGVSKPEHARRLARIADGVVVGSHFVRLSERGEIDAIKESARVLKEALKSPAGH